MFHIYIWCENIQEYQFVKSGDRDFLRNLMNDPVWTEHDMYYLAW